MGQAVRESCELMDSGPSKSAEALIAFFVPCACREEVLGDLYERYSSPCQYGLDGLRTVPLVILSRIRRTTDPQLLLIQAFALYMSFLAAAWFQDGALLREPWGLLRLAAPASMALLGLILEDTYANPGRRSPLSLIRGPVVGLGLALVSQSMFGAGNPDLAVPRWILFYGCGMSLVLSSAVRILFSPAADQLQGANAPVLWLKQADENPQAIVRVLKGVATILAFAIVATWMEDHSALPMARVIAILLFVLLAYQVWRRV
jgi:hypothetical protein